MWQRVQPSAKLPKKWKDFLRVDENKQELFSFLSEQIVTLAAVDGKEIYATHGESVVCLVAAADLTGLAPCSHADLTGLAPCSHEDAESCIFVHVANAVNKGCNKAAVRTVDTDIVAIAVAVVNVLAIQELWVGFGTGSSFRFIAIHEITRTMGPAKSAALPLFYVYLLAVIQCRHSVSEARRQPGMSGMYTQMSHKRFEN